MYLKICFPFYCIFITALPLDVRCGMYKTYDRRTIGSRYSPMRYDMFDFSINPIKTSSGFPAGRNVFYVFLPNSA